MDNNLDFRWIDTPDMTGVHLFTFDGEKVFNLFRDYPQELTKEQKEVFDAANPFWADFFKEGESDQVDEDDEDDEDDEE